MLVFVEFFRRYSKKEERFLYRRQLNAGMQKSGERGRSTGVRERGNIEMEETGNYP